MFSIEIDFHFGLRHRPRRRRAYVNYDNPLAAGEAAGPPPPIAGGMEDAPAGGASPAPTRTVDGAVAEGGPVVRQYVSKVSAYRHLKQIHRTFVESEIPMVGYREDREGRCWLILWPTAAATTRLRREVEASMGAGKVIDGGMEMALGNPGECREMVLGGISQVMRNLHW